MLWQQAKEELRALEQRILSAKNTIEALQVEVAQQEERLFMLMEEMGGAVPLPAAVHDSTETAIRRTGRWLSLSRIGQTFLVHL
jgi:hypothetical protein